MFSYYDTEFQPELRRADVERELARGRVHAQAALSRPRPGARERHAPRPGHSPERVAVTWGRGSTPGAAARLN